MGYPLHGQDISPTITPVQARLGWAVGWTKEAFFGDATRCGRRSRPARPGCCAACKAVGRGSRGRGMVVRDGDGGEVGAVTSGTFSPTLKTGIGLALLDARLAEDDVVTVDVRTRQEQFVVTKPPFVTPAVREP